MKRLIFYAALSFSVFIICGCLQKTPPSIPYEKESIVLSIKSDQQLNLYEEGPHALTLCIYQLRDPNAFNQLAEEQNGFSKLMDCERSDPTFLYSKRLSIQPSSEGQYLLDRAEGAFYLGVVAGYYYLPSKERVIRLYQIPVPGWLSRLKSNKFTIDLHLGQHQIQ